MDFGEMKRTVAAAEVAVREAHVRLVHARAVLTEMRAIEAKHRSMLIAAEPPRTDPDRGDPRRNPR
jgi:hypothetical protein